MTVLSNNYSASMVIKNRKNNLDADSVKRRISDTATAMLCLTKKKKVHIDIFTGNMNEICFA